MINSFLPAPPAWAAWTSLNTLGSANSKTSGNTCVITTSAAAEVNHVIVVLAAWDDDGTTYGETTHVSVSDSGVNSYQRAVEYSAYGGGSPGNPDLGAQVSIHFAKVTTQVANGGTITVTNDLTKTARGCSAWEFSITPTNTVSVPGKQAIDFPFDPPPMTISGLTSGEYLFIHAIAEEGPSTDSYTLSTSYTGMAQDGTTGNPGSSNMTIVGEFRILTGTGDTVDMTANSGNRTSVQGYVALLEAAPPAAGVPTQLRGAIINNAIIR